MGSTRIRWDVITPIERGEGENKKTHWVRIGSAFQKEGEEAWNILLDAFPVNGRIRISPPRPKDKPF